MYGEADRILDGLYPDSDLEPWQEQAYWRDRGVECDRQWYHAKKALRDALWTTVEMVESDGWLVFHLEA